MLWPQSRAGRGWKDEAGVRGLPKLEGEQRGIGFWGQWTKGMQTPSATGWASKSGVPGVGYNIGTQFSETGALRQVTLFLLCGSGGGWQEPLKSGRCHGRPVWGATCCVSVNPKLVQILGDIEGTEAKPGVPRAWMLSGAGQRGWEGRREGRWEGILPARGSGKMGCGLGWG